MIPRPSTGCKISFRRPTSECVGNALQHMVVAARHYDDHVLMQKSSRSSCV